LLPKKDQDVGHSVGDGALAVTLRSKEVHVVEDVATVDLVEVFLFAGFGKRLESLLVGDVGLGGLGLLSVLQLALMASAVRGLLF
jgi:hypothetical protein